MDSEWISDLKPSHIYHGLISIPAALGWIGFGLALLLGPHFATPPEPLVWAAWGAGLWFAGIAVLIGGWFALIALAVGVS